MTTFQENQMVTEEEMSYDAVRKSLNVVDEYVLGKPPEEKAKPMTHTEQYLHEYVTHTKHPLTMREAKFIDGFMAHGDGRRAVIEAGFKLKRPENKAKGLLGTDYIMDEIRYRQDLLRSAQIADRNEILIFLTEVMRGNVKDQFNLDATLKDRLDASEKLAKRLIDDPLKAKQSVAAQQVIVNLDFSRDGEPTPVVDVQQISD